MTDFQTVEGAFLQANLEYIDENYISALNSYDEAVELDNEKNWKIYDKRAACKIQLRDYKGAIEDCKSAIEFNKDTVTTYYRMGISYFRLGQFELAIKPFENALSHISKTYEYLRKKIRRWQRKVKSELRLRKESSLPSKPVEPKPELSETPKFEEIEGEEEEEKKQEKISTAKPEEVKEEVSKETEKEEEKKKEYDREEVVLTEDWPMRKKRLEEEERLRKLKEEEEGKSKIGEKIRFDYYQSQDKLTLNIYGLAKIPVKDRSVECTGKKLKISLPLPDGQEGEVWEKNFLLFDEVKSHSVRSIKPKLEITLTKMNYGNWANIEKKEVEVDVNKVLKYPTSKNIDWDDIDKEESKKKEEDHGPNSLFKQIYDSGNDETRRAMLKSLQESGGTVLSTNWEDVGKKRVKCSPPEGMERKRYDGYNYDGYMDSSDEEDNDGDNFSKYKSYGKSSKTSKPSEKFEWEK